MSSFQLECSVLKKSWGNLLFGENEMTREKLEKYIDDRLEYSSSCISLAVLAISEAKLSFLEAIEAQEEYDELYKN